MDAQQLPAPSPTWEPEELPPQLQERRSDRMRYEWALIAIGALWMGAAFAQGHGGWAAPGGTLLGLGLGDLLRWRSRGRKKWDLREGPPAPRWK